jgi:acetyltransferase-like isoleucine patch superfamily enzyme
VRKFGSHGDGAFKRSQFKSIGKRVVFEKGVRVWHPETVSIGENVYVGHNADLKGYHSGKLTIGDDTWIGQEVFFHAAGGIYIGKRVGIGPRVMILTSFHAEAGRKRAILDSPLAFKPVYVGDNSDIGIGAILLPGVRIGKGAQVGAGAVVTKDVAPYAVVAGNPARLLRKRPT